MALYSGIARTRNHQGPAIRPQSRQTLARGLRHQRAIGVMHLDVGMRLAPAWVNDVLRQRRVRWDEQTWLVHVAPDPVDTGIKQCLVLISPPFTRLWIREVWKCADPWPHDILVVVSCRCLAVEIARLSPGVNRVVGVDLDPGVHDAHSMESHLVELRK